MKVVNKNKVLLGGIIGLIILNISALIYQKYLDKKAIIPQVKEQENKNDTIAIMLEQSDGTYEKTTSTSFEQPGYVFNGTRSVCVDVKGQKLNNVLSYNETTKQMAIKTNNTAYCYVYFDKSLGIQIKDLNPNRLSTEVKGAMYRFQGQQTDNVENYICFGTSDKAQCTSDTAHYMYRIIGIEAETGRVKVIKKEALNDAVPWWDNYDEDITFPESKIYAAINGSQFLTNTAYVPTEWQEKISNNTWTYGDMVNNIVGSRQTGAGLYLTETGQKETGWYNRAAENTPGAIRTTVTRESSPYYGNTVYYTNGTGKWTDTFTSKVSLMYIHDYHYSVSDDANCQSNEGNYAICKTGWMHLSQNDTTSPSPYEWTMSRYGWNMLLGYFDGCDVNSTTGCTGTGSLSSYLSVRPVFYIDASNKLKDGIGTIDNPFLIK